MKIAYFDCFAGAGGDMIAAAMLDAGVDINFLKAQLATLGIEDLDVKLTETKRAGLRAVKFTPIIADQENNRNLKQITELINHSKISPNAKKTAISIFEKLAKAEANVHGKDVHEIHFHEVGAMDSIVDIVAAAVGLETLGIEKVYCSPLAVGGGKVRCEHGLMPVPAPATAELIKGIPINGGPIEAELLTPTAAAIYSTIVDEFGPIPSMKIEKIGYGAGSLESEKFPNVLRLILGEIAADGAENADSVGLLETNIDDVSGEIIGFLSKKLFEHGALDVFTTPIYMKEGRLGAKISIISRISDIEELEQVVLKEGVTFGVRRQILQRKKLAREFVTVETKYGKIRIKVGRLAGEIVNAKPEFADCVSAAKRHNEAIKAVLEAAMAEYRKSSATKKA